MFPIRDENPQILTPFATFAIMGLNILAWVFVQGLGSEPMLSASVCRLGLIPGQLFDAFPANAQIQLGPRTYCPIGDGAAWTTIFTSMFMHGGWFHIIGNMWFLWIFGNNVEDAMGPVRFVLFYLLCGLGAAGLQIAMDPESAIPMVGASGAIGGVMGAYIVLFPRVNVHMLVFLGFFVTTFAVPAVFMLGYWILIQLIGGFGSIGRAGGGVAFWAHIGGFVAGALLVFLFRKRDLLARHPYHGWRRRSPRGRAWHKVDR